MFTSIKNLSRGLAVMGYIKIGKKGEMKKSVNSVEYRQPKKLDHFEIVTREVDSESDNFKTDAEMMKILGDKPTDLQIMLQYDQIDLNFPHYLAAYKGSRLFCRGNGEIALREAKEIVCDPLTCPIYQKKQADQKLQCKPQGKLYAILPQKNMIGGVYAFKTTSWESIRNIISSLELLSALTGGILAGLILKLKLIPTRDQTPTGTTTNYKVAVVYQGKPQDLRILAVDERNLRAVSTIDRKAMEEARRKDIADGTDLQEEALETVAEFYPVSAGLENNEPENNGSETATKEPAGKKAVSVKPAIPVKAEVVKETVSSPLNESSPKATEQPTREPAAKQPVEKPAAEPVQTDNPNRIYLSDDVDMDIHELFKILKFSDARQKGQVDFHKNRLPFLLTQLIQKAKETGLEVIEAPAQAE